MVPLSWTYALAAVGHGRRLQSRPGVGVIVPLEYQVDMMPVKIGCQSLRIFPLSRSFADE